MDHTVTLQRASELELLSYTVIIIRLRALDFYEVIVDDSKGQTNYHLIEISRKMIFPLLTIY